jgi:hypothetical protein
VPAAQQNVLRLDVPVHHALAVRVGQSIGYLGGDSRGGRYREASLSLKQLPQRLALHIRHYEIRKRIAGRVVDHAGIENREDVGMLETGGELDLTEETLHPVTPA